MTIYKDYERPEVRHIVLADSMLKRCDFVPFAILFAIGGGSIFHFVERARTDRIVWDWRNYDLIVLNCGTNDIANGYADRIVEWVKDLHKLITRANPNIHFIVNGILPRPVDFEKSKKIVVNTNTALREWAKVTPNTGFYPVYHSFTKNYKPRADQQLFSRRDKLQLTCNGTGRMEKLMKQLFVRFTTGELVCTKPNQPRKKSRKSRKIKK